MASGPTKTSKTELSRRSFLKGGSAVGLLWGLAPHLAGCSPRKSWIWADLSTLRQALDAGELASSTLLVQCLDRIEELNPVVRAVIGLNGQVQGSNQPPPELTSFLTGIPVLLKDNMGTADDQPTSAGSAALANSRAPVDAGVVLKLKAAGSVIVGKTNMSEWSNLRSTNSTSGWSARGGQCRNPHDHTRSPSGSSSGAAVAVASGMVPLALGTEMIGSITCPASACGVVGLKPTRGMVDTSGIIPAAATFDCVGPITRSVRDAALALQLLAQQPKDFTGGLTREALKGARIGVARQDWGFDARVDQLMEEQLAVLSRLGAELVDPLVVPSLRGLYGDVATVWTHEFKQGVNHYLSQLSLESSIRSLADVIAFNRENPELEAMDFLGQDLLVRCEQTGPHSEPEYRDAAERLRQAAGQERLDDLLTSQQIEAVVTPTMGVPWVIDFVNGDHFEGGGGGPPALAGCPHITVPGGRIHGLPVGLSFYGPSNSEARLLALAYAYEQETRHYTRPPLQ